MYVCVLVVNNCVLMLFANNTKYAKQYQYLHNILLLIQMHDILLFITQ